jgi:hypothetical protein
MKFISDISLFWLIPIGAIAFFLTYLFYRKESWLTDIPSWTKKSLFALRFLSLFFIGILLLGILFESFTYRKEKPILITLVDNSHSLKNYKDSAKVSQRINAFNEQLKDKFSEKFELVSYAIGDNFRQTESFNLKDQHSNMSDGFEQIYSQYYNRNIGGIVFISDGNFNEGPNPIYSAEKIALTPIFTLGVGDTIPHKDQLIRDITTNEIAFLKNKFPVEIDIEALKVGKRNSKVSIFHNNKIVASTNVNFENGQFDFKHVTFELEATEIGFQNYVVEVAPIAGEYTTKNNRRSFYIEVLDGRNKIVLIAGAPHPDVSALKYVLEKDENVQVESKLIGDWDKKLDKVDLVIWHEPGINFNQAVLDAIRKAGKPILFFAGPNTNGNTIAKLDIGMSIGNSNQTDDVQPGVNAGFELFELTTELQNTLRFYPPVKVKYGEIRLNPQNKVLLAQRLGDFYKKDPILYFGEKANVKYGVFLGEGIWKWKINEYSRTKLTAMFEELIQKITQFLVIKQNASSLRITLPRRFSKGEEVKIKAEFYNESLELITKPKISFTLKDERNNKSNFEFGVSGNFYVLPLGTLKPGKYTWIASTNHNGKKHKKNGTFVVEDIEIESLETVANHGLLNQISKNSNGQFYQLANYEKLLNDLEKREDIVEMSYEDSAFNDLLDYFWLLLLICLTLTAEWFLRRWNGSY